MYNPYQLKNKTILVTGASSGIGRTTAIECSKLGARVIITARNESRLKETLNALEGDGHQMICADLTQENELDYLVENLPMLDGFVNDAGINIIKPISFVNLKDIEKIFGVNTIAPILLIKSLVKKKKINNNASIVVISSIATNSFVPGNSVYGASKSAIKTFVEYCAIEFMRKEIRVNSVHPGMIDTPMTQTPPLSANEDKISREQYLSKRYGKPEEVAWAIVYLLSDATRWVTGTQLVVDGGIHLK